MSETKFTKGPWFVQFNNHSQKHLIDIVHEDDTPGAISGRMAQVIARKSWEEEGVANAYLISSAPDLYEALEAVLKMLPIGFAATGRPGGSDDRNAALDTTRNKAIEALSRARGEQQ